MSHSAPGRPDLTSVLHGTTLLVQSASLDGRIAFANDAWKAILEYSDADLARGVSFSDIIAPDERVRVMELVARLRRGEGGGHVRTTFVTRTGMRVDVVGEVSPQRDAAGAVVATGGIFRDITEETREKLANERLRLRTEAMLAALTEGVVIINAAGMVEAMNDAAERILGASREVMVGARLLDLPWVAFDEDGRIIDRATHPILAALRTGEPQAERLLRYPRPDSTELWIATAARPLRQADGRIEGALSSFRDVTAEHLARAAVRASETRYRELFERNATVQLLVDVESGVIQAANPAAAAFYGYERTELVGLHLSVLSRVDHATVASTTASITSGRLAMFRRTQYTKGGEPREVEIFASPFMGDGQMLMHAIVIDVSSRVEAEQGRRRLAAILDQTPDIVGMFDLEGQLFYTNHAGRDLMGLPPVAEGADGAPMLDIPRDTIRNAHPGGDAERVLREATAVAAERGMWKGETTLRVREGELRVMNQVVIAHRDATGALSHFSSVMHDITEIRRAEMLLLDQAHELEAQTEELRQQSDELEAARDAAEAANVAKSQFLAHMSHELRTPLAAIIGFSRVLAGNRGGTLTPREVTYAERVAHNAVRLLALIDQLLDLSKVEAGKSELDLADVDVRAIVLDVVADLQGVPRAPGVELVADVPEAPLTIIADATKLRQVVTNLMGNALKFTSAGRVSVQVVPATGETPARLSVIDSGVGIAPENLGAIFEPFAQEDSTITRRFGGTGLGLAISRRFCEAMGFTLSVDSTVGEGSTFTVSFTSKR
jgi:PAS domain S-box-containing protein